MTRIRSFVNGKDLHSKYRILTIVGRLILKRTNDLYLTPSSLAMFHLTVFIALLLSCCLSLASAIPFERRTTGVITQCTVPNTVALTFVRRSCLPPVYEADFFFLYPASFFRMTVHTNICRTYFFHVDTTAGH